MSLKIGQLLRSMILMSGIVLSQEIESLDPEVMEEYDPGEEETEIVDDEIFGKYLDNPLNVNEADRESLLRIPGMTPQIVDALLLRRSLQPLRSIAELKSLDGMTPELYALVSRCVQVEKRKKSSLSVRQRAERDMQLKEGSQNGCFSGSPYGMTTRVVASLFNTTNDFSSAIRFGYTMKKDAGEEAKNGLQRWYAEVSFPTLGVSVVIGDYALHAGEGLILGYPSPRSRMVGSSVVNGHSIVEVQPFLSTSEEWNFQGVATTYATKSLCCTIFLSRKQRNGTLTDAFIYESINKGTLFRTTSELKKRHTLQEQITGGMVTLSLLPHYAAGVAVYRSSYNHALSIPTVFNDTLQRLFAYSFFGRCELKPVTLSGEFAVDINKNKASFVRSVFEFQKEYSAQFSFRHYPERFISLYGNAPVASGNYCKNETGVNAVVRMRPFSQTQVLLIYDQSSSKETKYATLQERQYFVGEVRYEVSSRCEVSVRSRWRTEEVVSTITDSLLRTLLAYEIRKTHQGRVLCTFMPTSKILFATSVEQSTVWYEHSHSVSHGWGLGQSLRIQPVSFLLCEVRFNAFDTESYDSRIVSFEPNLPGNTYTTVLYGEGIRWYGIVRILLAKGASLSLKYSQMAKEGIDGYGTGNDRIAGSVRSHIVFQIDCSF